MHRGAENDGGQDAWILAFSSSVLSVVLHPFLESSQLTSRRCWCSSIAQGVHHLQGSIYCFECLLYWTVIIGVMRFQSMAKIRKNLCPHFLLPFLENVVRRSCNDGSRELIPVLYNPRRKKLTLSSGGGSYLGVPGVTARLNILHYYGGNLFSRLVKWTNTSPLRTSSRLQLYSFVHF